MNCVSLYSCFCSLLYCTSLLSRTSTFHIMYKRSTWSLLLYQWYVYWLSEVEINLISTFSCINKLRNWSLRWLINCLSVSLIRLLIDQMIDWLIDWLIDRLIDLFHQVSVHAPVHQHLQCSMIAPVTRLMTVPVHTLLEVSWSLRKLPYSDQ